MSAFSFKNQAVSQRDLMVPFPFLLLLVLTHLTGTPPNPGKGLPLSMTAGQSYYWNTGNGSFMTASNWSPARTQPAATDILYFENGGTYTLTNFPSVQTFSQLFIQNSTNVTLDASFSVLTLTLAGDGNPSSQDFFIQSGSSLTLTSYLTPNITLRHAPGAGNIAVIDGVFNIGKAGQVLNNANYLSQTPGDVVTTVNGQVNVYGNALTGGPASVIFASTGVYNHALSNSPGSIPLATWMAGSVARITGYTNNQNPPLNLGQTFFDLEWNCPGQGWAITLEGQFPVMTGTFRVISTGTRSLQLNRGSVFRTPSVLHYEQTGGTLDIAGGSGGTTFKVNGQFSFLAGTITVTGSATVKEIELAGTVAQNVVMTGQVPAPVDLTVNNPNGINGALKLGYGANLTMKKGSVSAQPMYSGHNGLIYAGDQVQWAGPEWTGSISRLTLQNGAGVIATSSMEVSDELSLLSGILTLTPHVITLGTGTSSPGLYVHQGGWVHGMLRRWLGAETGSRYFHIGTATQARTILIDYLQAPAAGGTLTVSYADQDPGSSGLPIVAGGVPVVEISPTGCWTVESGNGLTGGMYSIMGNALGFAHPNGSPIVDPGTVRMIKRPTGGNWQEEGNSLSPVTLEQMEMTGLETFSQFGVGIQGVLPVELISFSVTPHPDANLIHWETASEQNSSHYELEKSENAQTWYPAGKVAAAGQSNLPLLYEFADPDPPCNMYYRLKSVDFDGKEEWHGIREATRPCPGDPIIQVYPNPATDQIRMEWSGPVSGSRLSYQLFHTNGPRVREGEWTTDGSQAICYVPLQGLLPGIYLLVIETERNRFFEKVLIR